MLGASCRLLLGASCRSSSSSLVRTSTARVASAAVPQQRCIHIEVDDDQNIDKAFRLLKSRMIQEGHMRAIKKNQFYEKPAQRRVRLKEQKEKRLAMRKVKEVLNWIEYKRDRGL